MSVISNAWNAFTGWFKRGNEVEERKIENSEKKEDLESMKDADIASSVNETSVEKTATLYEEVKESAAHETGHQFDVPDVPQKTAFANSPDAFDLREFTVQEFIILPSGSVNMPINLAETDDDQPARRRSPRKQKEKEIPIKGGIKKKKPRNKSKNSRKRSE